MIRHQLLFIIGLYNKLDLTEERMESDLHVKYKTNCAEKSNTFSMFHPQAMTVVTKMQNSAVS